MAKRKYTVEEDAVLAASKTGDLQELALRMGRSRQNLISRRNRLLRGDLPMAVHKALPPASPRVMIEADASAGRPAWFKDHLTFKSRLVSGR